MKLQLWIDRCVNLRRPADRNAVERRVDNWRKFLRQSCEWFESSGGRNGRSAGVRADELE